VVELAHEDPAMLERAKAALNRGEFLSEFIPVPEDLSIVAGRVGADEDQKQKDLVAQEEVNLAKHGYRNWYDYCVGEWGTKWDVGGDGCDPIESDGTLTLSFDSAWAPPVPAMQEFQRQGFEVKLYYYESGMCFAGILDAEGDDYYELGDMSSDEVASNIPTELDEMFCISEQMAEYEEENLEIDLDGGLSAINEQEQVK
jgi:hypothetical protein